MSLLKNVISKDRKRDPSAKTEDENFLEDQMTTRDLFLGPADHKYQTAAERSKTRKTGEVSQPESEVASSVLLSFSLSTSGEIECSRDSDDELFEPDCSNRKFKSQEIVMPHDIVTKTARTAVGMGISPHQATALVSSVIANSGGDIEHVRMSLSTSKRVSREIIDNDAEIFRSNITTRVKSSNDPVIVHFDGKIIRDFTKATDETKDRLCVLIRHAGETFLLGVPGLDHGTGEAQFDAIVELLNKFEIGGYLHGLCFDTTASNTGRLKGACSRLAEFHGRPLLLLACRHHIGEVHITHFNSEVEAASTKAPENLLFKKLKESWSAVKTEGFELLNSFKFKENRGTWLEEQARLARQTCSNLINREILRNSEVNEC